MTGHPTHGAPDTLMVKLCNQDCQSNLVGEIGSQWGNCSPGGPVISKFRRNLYSFGIGKAKLVWLWLKPPSGTGTSTSIVQKLDRCRSLLASSIRAPGGRDSL